MDSSDALMARFLALHPRTIDLSLGRIQQLLALWHFSARDSVRTVWQYSSIRRAPSLWESAVANREDSQTASVVYGHRRGIGTSFYLGATWTRSREPDPGLKSYQLELFAKGSWSFDVL